MNLGYGGNQKVAYRWAIDRGLDIVVLLHGDGQYAPEHMPPVIDPLLARRLRCGPRVSHDGRRARRAAVACRRTNVVGNRILTTIANRAVGAGTLGMAFGLSGVRG